MSYRAGGDFSWIKLRQFPNWNGSIQELMKWNEPGLKEMKNHVPFVVQDNISGFRSEVTFRLPLLDLQLQDFCHMCIEPVDLSQSLDSL